VIGHIANSAGGDKTGRTFPWQDVLRAAVDASLHLLVLGGGQIDCSDVARTCPSLRDSRSAEAFDTKTAQEVFSFFMNRNTALWAEPDTAAVAASVPLIVVAGNGEIPLPKGTRRQDGRTSQGIQLAAQRAFSLVQMGVRMEAPPSFLSGPPEAPLTQYFRIGPLGLIVLDRFAATPPFPVESLARNKRLLIISSAETDELNALFSSLSEKADNRPPPYTVVSPQAAQRCIHAKGHGEWITSSCRPPPAPRRKGWFFFARPAPSAPSDLQRLPLPGHGDEPLRRPFWLSFRLNGKGKIDGCWRGRLPEDNIALP